eukprot:gene17227-21063_t
MPSSSICGNYFHTVLSENAWLREGSSMMGLPHVPLPPTPGADKRVRRSGKYNPQEREKIRRERNRMHAKKTRDRKKFFLEMSGKIIMEMEKESQQLRSYLISTGVLREEDMAKYKDREMQFRREMMELRQQEEGEEDDMLDGGVDAGEGAGDTSSEEAEDHEEGEEGDGA